MRMSQFQQRLIDHELKICREAYKHQPDKLNGCIAGLHACAKQPPDKLGELLVGANTALSKAYADKNPRYWEIAMFHAEVLDVCDAMSALFKAMGMDFIIEPSKEAYAKMQMLMAGQADVVVEKIVVQNSIVGSLKVPKALS